MTVETNRDPRTRKEITTVSGKVDKIYFNKLKEVRTYQGKNGSWTPTHSLRIVVDGTGVQLGLTDKETLRAKDGDDKYHDVAEGMEVSVEILEIGEYKGAPQYSSQTSKVFILDTSGAVAPAPKASAAQPNQNQSYAEGDTTGIETGHAINGAILFLGAEAKSADILETAKQIHAITAEMKQYYRETFPKTTAYNVGAASGNAVLVALQIAKARDKGLDVVLSYAKTVVGNIAVPLSDYIRKSKDKPVAAPVAEEQEEVVEETPPPKAAPKPKAKTAPKKAPDPQPEDEYDEDIPFN